MLTDADLIKQRFHEFYNQREKQKHYTVQLPCHNINLELSKAEDTYLECPTCHKHYLFTHSAVKDKLYNE